MTDIIFMTIVLLILLILIFIVARMNYNKKNQNLKLIEENKSTRQSIKDTCEIMCDISQCQIKLGNNKVRYMTNVEVKFYLMKKIDKLKMDLNDLGYMDKYPQIKTKDKSRYKNDFKLWSKIHKLERYLKKDVDIAGVKKNVDNVVSYVLLIMERDNQEDVQAIQGVSKKERINSLKFSLFIINSIISFFIIILNYDFIKVSIDNLSLNGIINVITLLFGLTGTMILGIYYFGGHEKKIKRIGLLFTYLFICSVELPIITYVVYGNGFSLTTTVISMLLVIYWIVNYLLILLNNEK
ncbi:hypothetical protein [Vagococcus bubulae]|uniref:hypothetical protein n=1 Tax=Vagococcus bubulae TaxID=1977868 RepID=UPI0022DFBAF8|nr:hypothetical protein [Vagococcus bubulae]